MVKYIGKQARINRGWSAKQLSIKAKVSEDTIYNAEKNSHLPSLMTLDLIAIALKVNPWELVEFSRD
jgi:transcriptional regulator with XRE-family HTH domain